ncbi:MAG: B12-binding domain-containing radical SAM protein [Magnetococcales bacterium]|nr:B12-binding domain-containing radical SAM protein [Magnetococcales bacterium]
MNTLTFVTYLTRDMELMPVGPLTLATLARQRGWDVSMVDLPHAAEEDALVQTLAERTLVGLSTLCSTFHRSLQLASRVKALNPGVTVVMGGPQASAVAGVLLQRHECVDLVFQGEAEEGWIAYLDGTPLAQIPGLVYRCDGAILENPAPPLLMDLDRLPMPAFDLYRPSGISVPLETGRGCPFACTYCSTNEYFSRRFRAKSPGRILAEMDQLNTLYGVQTFDFIEDSFTINRRRIIEFCTALHRHHRAYHWQISARPDQVDAELLERLRHAGCRGIYFGIETGSQRLQKVVRKNLRVARAVENILMAKQSGLLVTVSFIIGFPDETEEDLRATLRVFGTLATQPEMVVQMHLLTPLAGSALVSAHPELAYDGMPTDFNENDAGCDLLAREGFRGETGLFPHRHYFANTSLPRSRYLFLAYGIRLCGWFFPNFLQMAFRWRMDDWIDYLLTTPVPVEMVTDPTFPDPVELWSGRGYAVCAGFARSADLPGLREVLAYDWAYCRISHQEAESLEVMLPRVLSGRNPGRLLPTFPRGFDDLALFTLSRRASGMIDVAIRMTPEALEARVQEICGRCGECCLDEDGLMCGVEEWGIIAGFLESHHRPVPTITPSAWQGLVLEGGIRYLAQPLEGERSMHDTQEEARMAAGTHGWIRHACAHLEIQGEGYRCVIQEVKPAECVAYPYRPVGDGGRYWHLEPVSEKPRGGCSLQGLLQEKPLLRKQYLEWALSRLDRRSGASALGWMHADACDDQDRRA